jgi:hypothetical protein
MLDAMTQLVKMGMHSPTDLPPLLQALGDLRIETRYDAIEIDSEEAIFVSLVRKECVGLALALQPLMPEDGTLAGLTTLGPTHCRRCASDQSLSVLIESEPRP